MQQNKYVKRSSYAIISALVLFFLGSCDNKRSSNKNLSEKMEGKITLSGAFALYPLANVWAEEFRKEYPDVKFNISAGGAGKGMADVLAGASDLALYSKDISQIEVNQGAYGFAVAKDAVIPTVSSQNPLIGQIKKEGVARETLSAYFLEDGKRYWKNTQRQVNVYTRSDASGAAEVWVKYLGGKAQEELKGIAVFGDPGLADAVKNDANGIGFNNVIYIYDLNSGKKYPGVDVAPIDTNGNGRIDPEEDFYHNLGEITAAIADGRYPSPPARELFFVSKGKPQSKAVKTFLNWILTKGQAFVIPNGYILLEKSRITTEINKI